MKVFFTKNFKKSYKKRIHPNPKLVSKFEQRYDQFTSDSSISHLRDHALSGNMQGLRAFSITGDIRVVYKNMGDYVLFMDIGTHNQVY